MSQKTESNWVSIDRLICKHAVFKKHQVLKVFLLLVVKARYTADIKNELNIGEILITTTELQELTGFSRQTLRTCLKNLLELSLITRRSTKKNRSRKPVITLTGYRNTNSTNQQTNQFQSGFVKLNRNIINHGLFQDLKALVIYIYLFTNAVYQESKWINGTKFKKGQLPVGRKKLSEKTFLSEQEVRSGLDRLEIRYKAITKKTSPKGTVITIKDNLFLPKSNQRTTSEQPASNQLATTPYKDKKGNKNKERSSLMTVKGYTSKFRKDLNNINTV